MAHAGFYHTNLLASEIRTELQHNQEKMFAIMQENYHTENYDQTNEDK